MSVIKSKREDKGLSVIQLSKKMAVHRQTIYYWESYTSQPSIKDMTKLGKILGIAPSKIMNDFATHYNK